MIDKENKRKYILYFLSMLAVGAAQLLDWYFGSEDPIWHIFFYIVLIPIISLIFTLLIKEKGIALYLFPFYSVLCTAIIYICMGNGGNAIIHGYVFQPGYLHGIFTVLMPAFVGSFLGVVARLISIVVKRRSGW